MILPYEGVWPTIHPTAFVHPAATVIGRVTVGPETSIWPGAVLRGDEGDIVIGAQTNIQDGTVVHSTAGISHVRVGDRATVGHNVILHGCILGSELVIGMGSTILDNARVEDGCFVGACSLVTMDKVIPAGQMVLGNPARILMSVRDEQRQFIDHGWRRYVENAKKHRAEIEALSRAEGDGRGR